MVDQLQLGDRVRLRGGEFVVRGLSPRAVVPGRVILESLATGERIEVAIDEIDDQHRSQSGDNPVGEAEASRKDGAAAANPRARWDRSLG
jgi:hypothetical protein